MTEQLQALARMIDHTLLKAEATAEQVRRLCDEAREYGFCSVCVNPSRVALAAEALAGSGVRVCTVTGFPLGATVAGAKAFEAERSIRNGAQEIDMVLNIGALKDGDLSFVRDDIEAVVKVCHAAGALCKVILETGYLSDAEKIQACQLAVAAGADFVKTSTGFAGGATAADVALMRATVGPDIGVKAAGGIRTYEAAVEMIGAGANRIGASAGVQIINAARQRLA